MKLRRYFAIALPVLMIWGAGCAGTTSGGGQSTSIGAARAEMIDRAVEKISPTIVRIKVVEPDYWQGRQDKFVAFGSGTIITKEGHVLTNHHVAGKALQLMVTLPNREEIPAEFVGTDPATDLAVIKLMPEDERQFPAAEFGDSDDIEAGDAVLALGSPGALSQSVTLGIVSNTAVVAPETWGDDSFELDGEAVGRLVRWIGHDAAIFPGNSGGPLVDLDGRIVGVNEIGMGLGGAIPGNLAKKVAFELIERGYVKRAYVGVGLQPLMKSSGMQTGVLVSTVNQESPAAKAGIEPGDVILDVDGTSVEGRFAEDLPAINNLMAGLPINYPVTMRISRDGEEMVFEVRPEERQPALVPQEMLREWGITARDVTLWTQIDLARRQEGGVIVTSTSPGGPAATAKPELKNRDIITEVNGNPIKTVGELVTFTKGITSGKSSKVPVLVSFERDAENFVTVVELGIEDLPRPGREVRKAWLPMETQPLTTDIAEQIGREGTKGVRITRLYEDRAEDFPLKVGDIITEVDGEPLDVSRIEDGEIFPALIRQYPIGADVAFKVIRGDDEIDVETELGSSPKRAREVNRYRNLDSEFVVREATFNDREKPVFQGVDFAVIADSVTSGGWAALAGLSVGDAILEINDKKIESLKDVEEAMAMAKKQGDESVIFFVRRGSMNMFLEMEPDWNKE